MDAMDFMIEPLFADVGDAAEGTSSSQGPVPRVVLEGVPVSDVNEHDKVRYNLNNQWQYMVDPAEPTRLILREGGPHRPDDYREALERCSTSRWVDRFRGFYRVVNVPRHHTAWMREASQLAVQKSGFSPLFQNDLDAAVADTACGDTFHSCDADVPGTCYFVRTERVSLKDGIHGVGPYATMRSIIESAVTARGGHQGVDEDTQQLKLYLFPWRTDLDAFREFRVFVANGRATAFSQQKLYVANPILAPLSERDRTRVVQNWLGRLLPYITHTIVPLLEDLMSSFVLDIVLLGPPAAYKDDADSVNVDLMRPDLLEPYFIEVNTFGFAYASGSSLFSWVEDYALLYGLDAGMADGAVAVRYTTP
ncbi:unnamed protein product [Symbiodinium natans]|uniref:Uncharacterized protein n=1 Tax=Symbiodinium natans TaxID=878477 RepID=A0A812VJ08_9DINO|nr:unnamed protein product [Symbiodinium natans]